MTFYICRSQNKYPFFQGLNWKRLKYLKIKLIAYPIYSIHSINFLIQNIIFIWNILFINFSLAKHNLFV